MRCDTGDPLLKWEAKHIGMLEVGTQNRQGQLTASVGKEGDTQTRTGGPKRGVSWCRAIGTMAIRQQLKHTCPKRSTTFELIERMRSIRVNGDCRNESRGVAAAESENCIVWDAKASHRQRTPRSIVRQVLGKNDRSIEPRSNHMFNESGVERRVESALQTRSVDSSLSQKETCLQAVPGSL